MRRRGCFMKGRGSPSVISPSRDLLASHPEAILPVTRQIIAAGAHVTGADAFTAFHQLEEFRRVRDRTFAEVGALVLPTAPTIYTVEEVLADPVTLNSRLGTYTNFVNLLDLCGLAVPASMQQQRPAVRHHTACAGRRGRKPRRDRAAIPRRDRPAARRAQSAAAAARKAFVRAGSGRDRARRRRRASFRHAAQRRIARGGRAPSRNHGDRAALPALCARRDGAAKTRTAAREERRGRRPSRSKSGRCRKQASAASSPLCRRRSRSARWSLAAGAL